MTEPVFEPDADLDWWLNMLDLEIVFEPEVAKPKKKDNRKRHKTEHRGVTYRERVDGSKNYSYYSKKHGRYINGYDSAAEALVDQKREKKEAEARRKALSHLPDSMIFGGRKVATDQGGVYFIQGMDGGPVKIGWTKGDPEERLKQLQTGSPITLRIVGWLEGATQVVENELHKRLSFWRLHGEWFQPARELYELMRAWESSS